MKNRLFIIALLLLSASCTSEHREVVRDFLGESITATDLKFLMENDYEFVLIDLRNRNQYDDNHIPGAVNIPVGEIRRINDSDYENYPIIIYATEEAIQKSAYKTLIMMDYKNVHMLQGGFFAWTYGYESD